MIQLVYERFTCKSRGSSPNCLRFKFPVFWHALGTFTLTDEPVLEPPKRLEQELKKLNLKSEFFRSPKPGDILQLTKEAL